MVCGVERKTELDFRPSDSSWITRSSLGSDGDAETGKDGGVFDSFSLASIVMNATGLR